MNTKEIKTEFNNFLKTEEGRSWQKEKAHQNMSGDFGDYLYDFYPEYLA